MAEHCRRFFHVPTHACVPAGRPPASVTAAANRRFGAAFTLFFVLVALGGRWHGGAIRTWAVAVAATIAGVTLIAPALLTWPRRAWLGFGALMHRITSPVVLALLYFGALLPVGLVARAFRHDPLRRRRPAGTLWMPRVPPARPDAGMRHQF